MSDSETLVAPRQVVQRDAAKPQSAGAKVVVFCKIPSGIRIRNFRWVDQREQVLGGGTREFRIAEPFGPEYLINGNRFRIGAEMTHRITGGYGVTEGVDKEAWDNWLEVMKDEPIVLNQLIFAAEKRDYGEDQADDLRDNLSGLEPLQKDGDPRSPRSGANLDGIKTAEV